MIRDEPPPTTSTHPLTPTQWQMINAMMVKRPELHYYQGYHDILSVLVLVLTDSEELCFAVAERLTLGFLGDCMLRPDFRSLTLLLELLGPLVTAFDPDVGRVLEEAGVHAYVSLPWVITWWSHDSRELGRCARMYDAFLAAPPVFPLYVAAAMIARARTELLAMGPEERDFASVHTFLARLAAREDLPVEALIVDAMRMLRKRPPAALVRASGSPALVEAVRRGEIHALAEPPGGMMMRVELSACVVWFGLMERFRLLLNELCVCLTRVLLPHTSTHTRPDRLAPQQVGGPGLAPTGAAQQARGAQPPLQAVARPAATGEAGGRPSAHGLRRPRAATQGGGARGRGAGAGPRSLGVCGRRGRHRRRPVAGGGGAAPAAATESDAAVRCKDFVGLFLKGM